VVTWLKAKYAVAKPVGSNRSKHNDGRRSLPRRKANDKERAAQRARQPVVTLVLDPATGRRRWERVYPNGGTT
jgi:hypothetical protein